MLPPISRSHHRVKSSSGGDTRAPLAPVSAFCHRVVFFLLVALLTVAPLVPAAWEAWGRNGMVCVVGLMMLVWIVSQLLGRDVQLVSTLLNAPMMLLATYAVIRYGLSDVEWVARRDVLLLLGMALLFFMATNVIRHRWQFVFLMWIPLGVGVVLSLQGLWQMLYNEWGSIDSAMRREAIRGNFVETADHLAYLHMAFPIAVAVFFFSRRTLVEKILCAFASVILVAGMVATGDLHHWFGWMVSVAVLGGYLLRKRGWKFHRVLVGAGVLLVVVTISWLAVLKLDGIAPPQPVIGPAPSIATVPLWRSAVTMAVRNPLIGIGPGMFTWRYPEYRSQQGSPTGADSGCLTFLAEYGVTGALLALSAVVAFCVVAIQILNARARRYSVSSNSNRYAFAVAGLAVMAVALVDAALASGFDASANQFTLVTILAATVTCGLHHRDEHPEKIHTPGKHNLFRLTGIHRVMLTSGFVMALSLFLWLLMKTIPSTFLLERARQRVAQKDFTAAEGLYRKAIRFDVRNFEAMGGLADLCAVRDESTNHDQVLSLYERALARNPYAYELYVKIAHLYDAAGKREKAAEQYQLAIQSDPRNAAYYIASAQHHLRWDERDLAQAAFRRAAALDPACIASATNAPATDSSD